MFDSEHHLKRSRATVDFLLASPARGDEMTPNSEATSLAAGMRKVLNHSTCAIRSSLLKSVKVGVATALGGVSGADSVVYIGVTEGGRMTVASGRGSGIDHPCDNVVSRCETLKNGVATMEHPLPIFVLRIIPLTRNRTTLGTSSGITAAEVGERSGLSTMVRSVSLEGRDAPVALGEATILVPIGINCSTYDGVKFAPMVSDAPEEHHHIHLDKTDPSGVDKLSGEVSKNTLTEEALALEVVYCVAR